jgi:CHAT domain-containing protein
MLIAGCKRAPGPQTSHDQIVAKISQGDLNGALADVDHAYVRYGASGDRWNWTFRILKAQILLSRSQPKEALAVISGDLPSSLASSELAVKKILYEGIAYRYGQEYDKSERKLAEAEALATSSQPRLLCQVLNAKGALLVEKGKFVEAEQTHEQALKLAREHGRLDQQASAQVSLAWVAIKRERYGEAVDRGQSALELSRSLGMQSYVATVLGNMGWANFELGDFESALEFYKQGAEASERTGLVGYSAYWFTGVANSYIALHDYARAEALSKETLKHARDLKNAQTITECLNTLAELALRGGRLSEAENYNQEAIEIENAGLDHFGVLESLLLSGRIAMAQKEFARAEKTFRRVVGDPQTETALRWEAHARLAEVHNAEGLVAQADREYRASIDTIETARSGVDRTDLRLSYLSGGIEFYDDYIRFLISHGRAEDALQVAELSRARTLTESLEAPGKALSFPLPSFDAKRTAKRLRATLLLYWLGEKESYLWVITPAQISCLTLSSASNIDARVKAYREALLGGRDVLATNNADGRELYRMLVAPARNQIPSGSRVIVLPDGSLYGLNFETLLVPEPKRHFWIEDVTLITASSLTLLSAQNSRTRSDQKILLVGNVVPAGSDFPVLREAAAEIEHVERHFEPGSHEVLAGAQATRAAYLGLQPQRFSYLHFVTHGTASRAHPLDSAVILSAPANDSASYKLYARDIVAHPLSAYLVTISACNGSGTRAYSGEGLVGLAWAFLRAGARNVIAALWEVNDASTPQLMDRMYAELSDRKDPAMALRDAKLSLLHSEGVFQKPFYWAPFQLYTRGSSGARTTTVTARRNAD